MKPELWVLIGTALTALLGFLGTRRRSDTNMETVYVQEMKTIVETYKEQSEKLKEEVRLLQEENRLLRIENERLKAQEKGWEE